MASPWMSSGSTALLIASQLGEHRIALAPFGPAVQIHRCPFVDGVRGGQRRVQRKAPPALHLSGVVPGVGGYFE